MKKFYTSGGLYLGVILAVYLDRVEMQRTVVASGIGGYNHNHILTISAVASDIQIMLNSV